MYDEADEVAQQQDHENDRMKFKLFQSKVSDRDETFQSLKLLKNFQERAKSALKPTFGTGYLKRFKNTLPIRIPMKTLTLFPRNVFWLKYELDSGKH
jgi:hypothetical protein